MWSSKCETTGGEVVAAEALAATVAEIPHTANVMKSVHLRPAGMA